MCGIVGNWGNLARGQGLAAVRRMADAIRHRGPDGEGLWSTDGFAFGMRRLSIIDLATGGQPMWSGDGEGEGLGIVFNGEIYNYRALRARLEAKGHRFRTHSDTEVVLRSYLEEGAACVQRFEGMFAFCLYDPGRRRLHLVRDRLGKKPLYYGRFGGRFLFASEIKAILAAVDKRPALNFQSLHHYLTLRYVPEPDTVWQSIYKIEPASWFTLDLDTGQSVSRRYWSLSFRSEPPDPSRDYLGEFTELFLDSVEKRLTAADVPVGVLLSGGLDSSSVSAAAVLLGHRRFHTFSVAFSEGGEFAESRFARAMAAHIGSEHHEIVIGQSEFLEFFPDFVRFSDEPLADLAGIPLFFVSRLARDHVKVVLSGEGSDEVLAGYNLEKLARILDWAKPLERVPASILQAVALFAPGRWGKGLASLARAGRSGFPRQFLHHQTNVWSEELKRDLWRDAPNYNRTDDLIRSWYDETMSPHPLDQIQQVYCKSWLIEDLLMKADKMSMANSLELRAPFLDHRLVEWAAHLPVEWKVGSARIGYSSKRVLRRFAQRHVPRVIIDRPKQGFPVPAYRWLKDSLGTWAEERVVGPKSRLNDLMQLEVRKCVVHRARSGAARAAHQVWVLLVLEQWLRVWA